MRKILVLGMLILLIFIVSCSKDIEIDKSNNIQHNGILDGEQTIKGDFNILYGSGYEDKFPDLKIQVNGLERNNFYSGEYAIFSVNISGIPANIKIAKGTHKNLEGVDYLGKKNFTLNEKILIRGAWNTTYKLFLYEDNGGFLGDITDNEKIIELKISMKGKKESEKVKGLYYYKDVKIVGSDKDTFKIIYDGKYARDKNNLYVYTFYNDFFKQIEHIDPSTFKYIGGEMLSDKNGIYIGTYGGLKVNYEIDTNSIEYLGGDFYKDIKSIYIIYDFRKKMKVLNIQDTKDLRLIKDCSVFIATKNKLYFNNNGYSSCSKKTIEKYKHLELVNLFDKENNNIQTINIK